MPKASNTVRWCTTTRTNSGAAAVPRLTQDGHVFASEAMSMPAHSTASGCALSCSTALWMIDNGQNSGSFASSGAKAASSASLATKRARTGREVQFSTHTVEVTSITLRPCASPLCTTASKRRCAASSSGTKSSRSRSTGQRMGAKAGSWMRMERGGSWRYSWPRNMRYSEGCTSSGVGTTASPTLTSLCRLTSSTAGMDSSTRGLCTCTSVTRRKRSCHAAMSSSLTRSVAHMPSETMSTASSRQAKRSVARKGAAPSSATNTGMASKSRRRGEAPCISSQTARRWPATSTSTMSSNSSSSHCIACRARSEALSSVWFTPPSDSMQYVISRPVPFFTPTKQPSPRRWRLWRHCTKDSTAEAMEESSGAVQLICSSVGEVTAMAIVFLSRGRASFSGSGLLSRATEACTDHGSR